MRFAYKGQLVRAVRDSGCYAFTKDRVYTVDYHHRRMIFVVANNEGRPDGWGQEFFEPNGEQAVKNETITLGVRPSLADDLSLYPNDRKVLAHLSKGHTITKLEAQSVYGNWSLAGSVFRLRESGYKVRTENCRDATGHRYARYSLLQAA